MQDICVIGIGKLGGALAIALTRAGWRVDQLVVRNDRLAKRIKRSVILDSKISSIERLSKISSRIVFICVDDPEIANVAAAISPFVNSNQTVFHTSGSQSSSVLSQLSARGASAGSFHPLTSISDPFTGADQFPGTYICVEGNSGATKLGRKIARSLGGVPFSIDAIGKALYHAAAVTAAGHATALFANAIKMMEFSGIKRRMAGEILIPLLKSTVSNLERQDPKDALTGTFSRLDLQTFKRHLNAFDNLPPDLVHLYLELGERSLDLVQKRDGRSRALDELREAVSIAKRKFRC